MAISGEKRWPRTGRNKWPLTTQQTAWADLVAIRNSHESQFPSGWLSWLIDMRHLNVHRARQIHMWLQKTREEGEPQLRAHD